MRLFGIVEIRLITKKRQILEVLQTEGRLKAIKKCMELNDWSLTKSNIYVNNLMLKYEDKL